MGKVKPQIVLKGYYFPLIFENLEKDEVYLTLDGVFENGLPSTCTLISIQPSDDVICSIRSHCGWKRIRLHKTSAEIRLDAVGKTKTFNLVVNLYQRSGGHLTKQGSVELPISLVTKIPKRKLRINFKNLIENSSFDDLFHPDWYNLQPYNEQIFNLS